MKIEWKPSELPAYVIVRAQHPWVEGLEAYWAKNDDGTWGELEADYPAHINIARQDELLDINYIEAVPKSWYEEFNPLPDTPWEINREGYIRNRKTDGCPYSRVHVPSEAVSMIFDYRTGDATSLSDSVRKAFA